jgi:hypothetical protein
VEDRGESHEASEQTALPGAEVLPRILLEFVAATQRFYHPSTDITIRRQPTDFDIAKTHVPEISLRTWQRRKAILMGKDPKHPGPDWLEGVWPPPDNWHPSWEALIPQSMRVDNHTNGNVLRLVYEETIDKVTGKIERRLIEGFDHLAPLAAAIWFLAWCSHLPHVIRLS